MLEHARGERGGERCQKVREWHGCFDSIVRAPQVGHLLVLGRQFTHCSQIHASHEADALGVPIGRQVLLQHDSLVRDRRSFDSLYL